MIYSVRPRFAQKIVALCGYILYFTMLFVPTAYKPIKAMLLILIVGGIGLILLLRQRLSLHPTVVVLSLVIACANLGFTLLGLYNFTPGALRVGTFYVFWSFVYLLLVSAVSNRATLEGLLKTIVVAHIAICIYSLSYILYTLGWLPRYLYIPLDQGQSIGLYTGFIEFRLYSISSLIYTIPFFVSTLLTWPSEYEMPISRFWLWVALLLGLVVSFLSGRRALWVIVALSPLLALLFRLFLSVRNRKHSSAICRQALTGIFLGSIVLFVYLQQSYGFQIETVSRHLTSAFFPSMDAGASIREHQFYALIDGWLRNPYIGAGHGAAAPGYVRAPHQPWAYELTYVALLFQTGLIGILIFAAGIFWIYFMGIHVMRRDDKYALYVLPVLTGTTCFLLANASNPYLGKFDYLWVIFLPIAFINTYMLGRSKSSTERLEKPLA